MPKRWPWTGPSKGMLEADESTIRRFCSMLARSMSACYAVHNRPRPINGFLDLIITMELGPLEFAMRRMIPMRVLRRMELEETTASLVEAVLFDIDTTMLREIKMTAQQQRFENNEEDRWKLGPKGENDAG